MNVAAPPPARVLVVQESRTLRTLLANALRDAGHTVVSTGDGERGVQFAGALIDEDGLDVLVCDARLPGRDGVEVIRLLRARYGERTPYAILLTSEERGDRKADLLDAGADDLVQKPADPAEVLARVRAGARVARLTAETRRQRDVAAGILRSIRDGIVVMSADAEIVEVNDALCRMTGLRRDELIGARPPYPYWFPEDRLARMDAVRRRIAAREVGDADARLRHASGRAIPVIVSSAPLPAQGSALPGIVVTFKDVAHRRRQAARDQALRRVATAVANQHSPAELCALVAEEVAHILECDEAAVARLGDTGAEVLAAVPASCGEPVALAALARCRASGEPAELQAADGYADGEPRYQLAVPIRVAGVLWGALLATHRHAEDVPPDAVERLERFGELVGMAIDNAQARERLQALADDDPLTGLANHRVFHERLAVELAASEELTLVLLDIDHFKDVNDTHGHQLGDRVLRVIAERMNEVVRRDVDTVARVGGEEFAMILPGAGATTGAGIAERLRSRVESTNTPPVGCVSVSLGVAARLPGEDAEALYARADAALYAAKRRGRNRVALAEAGPG
ncbi:MAG TPA: diguanylate cyclase [Miltoncostaeaceae bacterium]|nr:diguanylate cyclase [Miltoncostaeaceae bacterium]